MKTKTEKYRELIEEVNVILEGESDPIVWMSTLSCLIKQALGYLWVGFYRVVEEELLVGPYQGTLGCLRISFERGVCGKCASEKATIIVADVHEFPGHIACDTRSTSEIVIPVFDSENQLQAVLDIDSTEARSFDAVDQEFLEQIAGYMKDLKWVNASEI